MSEQVTNSYTYTVDMVVSVFAENQEQAFEKLNVEGGYVSKRVVNLVHEMNVFTPEKDES